MKVGDYCFIKGISRDYGIGRITQLNSGYSSNGGELIDIQFNHSKHSVPKINVISSPNIIDLVQYMDLLEIENKVKLYDENREVYLFNPVRCDGFTEYANNVHCIILNTDYIVNIKDLKIKSILTYEQIENMKYKIESEVN